MLPTAIESRKTALDVELDSAVNALYTHLNEGNHDKQFSESFDMIKAHHAIIEPFLYDRLTARPQLLVPPRDSSPSYNQLEAFFSEYGLGILRAEVEGGISSGVVEQIRNDRIRLTERIAGIYQAYMRRKPMTLHEQLIGILGKPK